MLQGWYVYICDLIIESMQDVIGQQNGSDRLCHNAQASIRLQNVVNVIDSSLITLAAKPACDNAYSYVDRNTKTVSVHLQAVVDARGCFLHVEAGPPGLTPHTTVLRGSDLFQTIGERIQAPGYLLGHRVYPLLDWLMTPYRENKNQVSDLGQQIYNDIHSETLGVIDIHLLRWRRLMSLSIDIFKLFPVSSWRAVYFTMSASNSNSPSPNFEIPSLLTYSEPFDPNLWVSAAAETIRKSKYRVCSYFFNGNDFEMDKETGLLGGGQNQREIKF